MTDLLLNSFLVLITVFFGAMAYYPLFLGKPNTARHASGEDRVISVVPKGLEPHAPTRIGPTDADADTTGEHPGESPAA